VPVIAPARRAGSGEVSVRPVMMGRMTQVYLEAGAKKVFACAVDWPGWCRAAKGEEAALAALRAYAPRYRVIAERAGLAFDPGAPEVVERVPGNATPDFGAPAVPAAADRVPVDPAVAERELALLRAAWEVFDEVAAATPAELRKGPRGGGRDRDRMIAHVVESERGYARQVGVRHRPFAFDDREARDALRADLLRALAPPWDGAPPTPRGWPHRYAVRRLAWHVIDHLWEMEDRRT